VGGRPVVLAEGERLTVSPGTLHCYANAGPETAHFVAEIRPALQFESVLQTLFHLAEIRFEGTPVGWCGSQ
jgi:quercetin dioxygenase-like cupin family protein